MALSGSAETSIDVRDLESFCDQAVKRVVAELPFTERAVRGRALWLARSIERAAHLTGLAKFERLALRATLENGEHEALVHDNSSDDYRSVDAKEFFDWLCNHELWEAQKTTLYSGEGGIVENSDGSSQTSLFSTQWLGVDFEDVAGAIVIEVKSPDAPNGKIQNRAVDAYCFDGKRWSGGFRSAPNGVGGLVKCSYHSLYDFRSWMILRIPTTPSLDDRTLEETLRSIATDEEVQASAVNVTNLMNSKSSGKPKITVVIGRKRLG